MENVPFIRAKTSASAAWVMPDKTFLGNWFLVICALFEKVRTQRKVSKYNRKFETLETAAKHYFSNKGTAWVSVNSICEECDHLPIPNPLETLN